MNKEDVITFKGYMIEHFLLEKIESIPKDKKGIVEIKSNSFQNTEKGNEQLYRVNLNVVTYTEVSKLDLTFEGLFEIKNLDKDTIDYFLRVSAPAILYPYMRAFISNVTSFDIDSTVILPVINFADF